MVAARTRTALADRAIKAADLLDFWSKELQAEMKKQGVEPHPTVSESSSTVTLPRETVRNMVGNMRGLMREIRDFEKN